MENNQTGGNDNIRPNAAADKQAGMLARRQAQPKKSPVAKAVNAAAQAPAQQDAQTQPQQGNAQNRQQQGEKAAPAQTPRRRQPPKRQPAAEAAQQPKAPSGAASQQQRGAGQQPKAPKQSAAGQQTKALRQPAQAVQAAAKQPAQVKEQPRRAQQSRSRQGTKADKGPARLKVIPLGGLDEIGKNITIVEYGDDIIILDCGSIFPNDDMPGVDLVIPDVEYLEQNREKIRGMLITHGHEDHIGSIPHVLKLLGGSMPIYGTRLTLALIEHKLKEHRILSSAELRTVKAGETVKLGVFEIEFVHVNHSIIDAVAFSIKTPAGVLIFTGDFKIDYTPIDDQVTDLQKFAELGKKGVLALFMESTNVERSGYTMSERRVGETFDSIFPKAPGRIIIAMFSSNVHRVQQVVDSAVRFGRMVCLTGRSMLNYSSVAQDLGLLKIPHGRLIDIDDLERHADDEVVIITTGSQGENMAGLSRMAFDEHRKLSIRKSDTVVISAHPIPGNEKSVSRVINQLFHKGAYVIYESLAEVHVSGHACQEELKLMHALIKPKYFVPIHGEYRHLKRHAQLARLMGVPEQNAIIASVGDVIEFSRSGAKITGQVPAGQILLDGSSIGDVGNVVLRDRKLLAQDGLLVAVMPIDISSGKLCGPVEIVSRGFVYMRESEDLLDEVKKAAQNAVTTCQANKAVDINAIRNEVRDEVRGLIYRRTKRTPMILPVVVESKEGGK